MLLSDAVKSRITELMKNNNIKNIHELALLAGVPYATINDFFRGRTDLLKLDKLVFICEAFHIELTDFFDSSYFKEVECIEND